MTFNYRLAIIILITLIFSCSHKQKSVIPKEKFIAILTDIHITDGILYVKNLEKKYKKQDTFSVYNACFKKHNISRKDFEETVDYYSQNPKEYIEIYNEVDKNFNDLKEKYKDAKEKQKDESNLWSLKENWNLPDDGKINPIAFTYETKKHGKYEISAKIKLFIDDKTIAQRMTIVANYADGTRETNSNGTIVKDAKFNTYKTSIKTNTKKTLTSITGWVLDHSKGTQKKHAEIRNIKLELLKEPVEDN